MHAGIVERGDDRRRVQTRDVLQRPADVGGLVEQQRRVEPRELQRPQNRELARRDPAGAWRRSRGRRAPVASTRPRGVSANGIP